jgi:hypothetical protein
VIAAVIGGNISANLIVVLIFGIVGFGVQRGWRSVAVLGATFLTVSVIGALAQGIFPGVITPFVLIGLVNGVRGTFAVKRLGRTRTTAEAT